MTRIRDLFSVVYGNKFDLNKMTLAPAKEGIAFVSRRGGQNGKSGVAGFVRPVEDTPPYPPGLITVALGGSILSSYVQQRPFYTGQNVAVLTPRDVEMPQSERLYYAMCIHHNAFRYSTCGREANRTLRDLELPETLPTFVHECPIPDFSLLAHPSGEPQSLAAIQGWTAWRINELFEVQRGRHRASSRESGTGSLSRLVTASALNNGVTGHINCAPMFPAGSLSVAINGSIGATFYQPEPFCATGDVAALLPKDGHELTALQGLFVAALLRREAFRYNYGRKWRTGVLGETQIRLPTTPDGGPDWQAIQNYMSGLPWSSAAAQGQSRSQTQTDQTKQRALHQPPCI